MSAVPTAAQIRQSFLDFFKEKQHTIVPSDNVGYTSRDGARIFTNAGMNQFVPIFLGERSADVDTWPGVLHKGLPTRAADTQKCIRAGGKHNDLEDVGLDTYHHTLFEMLGNWSFGDYFKKEAISWAWELVIERWKFPPTRVFATIYQPDKSKNDPAERDQEAWDIWAEKFRSIGLDPEIHIVNGNKKDNFWMMGDTGPCGPCTEIHIDLTPGPRDLDEERQRAGAKLVNGSDASCIEIWNNVFIQYNATPEGTFEPLPAKHVDTGMGFERVCSIIQGTKGFTDFENAKISNYDTDVFKPIFDELTKLSGKEYKSTLPKANEQGHVVPVSEQEKIDVAFRVIADHLRTLSFAIADGIQPGNSDRNYTLRRILRRAVKYGRTLEFKEPFFYKLVDVLAAQMGDVFPEVRTKKEQIKSVLKLEEESFNRTLDKGIALFEKAVSLASSNDTTPSKGSDGLTYSTKDGELIVSKKNADGSTTKMISGELAFRLYDQEGFPFDLTELMAREQGLGIDRATFNELMEEQRERARKAGEKNKQVVSVSEIETKAPTKFIGYDALEADVKVLEVVSMKDKTAVVLDVSTCYAEMGGQIGDAGQLILGANTYPINATTKVGNTWLHFLDGDEAPAVDSTVKLIVDAPRRHAIERHHTVTHILHWALHEVVSKDATQKGSSVTPDKLTFDFNSGALTAQQIADIERLVNERIVANEPVSWTEVPYVEAKANKGIMALFGEKYGDLVRVVQIGGQRNKLDGWSMELCGGTHTRSTGEIGLFRLVGESAVAAGVRRIEAIAGLEAYNAARADAELLKLLAGKVSAQGAADLEKKLEQILTQQKELEKALKAAQQREASTKARELMAKAVINNAIVVHLGDVDADYAVGVAEALKASFNGIVVLGATGGGSVALIASVAKEHQGKVQAGKIIQGIAPIVGGKGGGKPDFARGGGKDVSKVDAALAEARKLIGA
ncbi:alanine--tRNA ligase [Prosthecobacter vanneervenii]|uniref:Alanine--tRNA ligase n=1 Tax=Prosthecobacter vanneervenii TaxID=48466 RepID=A0A7W7YAE7_9BACT|nr:alanine--tRNA ligase [Prosthecobacter vanneervenii]MBB5032587.1 alanyl-tRNA synthetase [Prosthecobacter vanneervenii]